MSPVPVSNKIFRIKTTITIPEEWIDKIQAYMKRKGFQDYAELFRHLIYKEIIKER